MTLRQDVRFSFPLGDRYWAKLLAGIPYEPEIEALLTAAAARGRFGFIDCGANYGYWSAMVSGELGGYAVAVEPALDTFKILTRNAELNRGRFATERAAISSESGRQVRITGRTHASRRISDAEGEGDHVATKTIDLVREQHPALGSQIILKLDIEGEEVNALAGAANTLTLDPLIIYEDHGSDRNSAVTAHMLSSGFLVYALQEHAPPWRVSDASDLVPFKRDRRLGYNLVAVRAGSVWTPMLEALIVARAPEVAGASTADRTQKSRS